jgi:hypothetical protein
MTEERWIGRIIGRKSHNVSGVVDPVHCRPPAVVSRAITNFIRNPDGTFSQLSVGGSSSGEGRLVGIG